MIKLEQVQLDSVISAINSRAKISNTYTKTEVDAKIVNVTATGQVVRSMPYLSQSGYGVMGMLLDGVLYSASGGTSVSYVAGCSGFPYNSNNTNKGIGSMMPINIPKHSPIIKAGSFVHEGAFALLANGDLYTWGYNSSGVCGLSHTSPVTYPTLTAVRVSDVFFHESQGNMSVNDVRLFILRDGLLYGAGYNGYGALGDGTTTNRSGWTQVLTSTPNLISKVFNLGSSYGCTIVLKTDGSIWACGYNGWGNLGNGNTTSISTFTNVTAAWAGAGVTSVQDIKFTGSFGYYEASNGTSESSLLALITLTNGTKILRSCGGNSWGQLGDGTSTAKYSPVTVSNSSTWGTITDISSRGAVPSCRALIENGDMYSWGFNGHGSVGNNSASHALVPVKVATLVAKLLGDGMCGHTYSYYHPEYITKTDGSLWGVGFGNQGTFGTAVATNSSVYIKIPLPLATNEKVTIMGRYNTTATGVAFCAYTDKGNFYAWGYNDQYNISNPAQGPLVPCLIELPFTNK